MELGRGEHAAFLGIEEEAQTNHQGRRWPGSLIIGHDIGEEQLSAWLEQAITFA
jgi:hypothetical protein